MLFMRKLIVMGCLVVFVLMSACGNPEYRPDKEQDDHIEHSSQELSELLEMLDQQLITANQQFALNIYQALGNHASEENVFISPLSISLALAMTYNGADGETKENMANILQLDGMTVEEVNKGYATLEKIINASDPNVELSIANSLWSREGLDFNEDFMQRNKEIYNAEANVLDFSNSNAANTINKWVDQNTKGKIKEIIEGPISEDTILFLINAIYFKGDWTQPFNEKLTSDQEFYLSDGTTIQHPLMSQSGSYDYLENELFQAIRLPYGNEEHLSMLIFLPAEDSDLTKFHSMLTMDNWNSWMAQFKMTRGSFQMPRFKLEYEATLNDALKSLGMTAAFESSKADFNNMITGPLKVYIDSVKHKSFIEVNEIGTEAAAVTSVEAATTSATTEPDNFFNMTVNRPFFFTIMNEPSDTILFMGAIEIPKQ